MFKQSSIFRPFIFRSCTFVAGGWLCTIEGWVPSSACVRESMSFGRHQSDRQSTSVTALLQWFCSSSSYTHAHTLSVGRRQTAARIREAYNDLHAVYLSLVPVRDGKELEPSKNEPNKNKGFAKNRTEQNPNPNVMVLTRFFH